MQTVLLPKQMALWLQFMLIWTLWSPVSDLYKMKTKKTRIIFHIKLEYMMTKITQTKLTKPFWKHVPGSSMVKSLWMLNLELLDNTQRSTKEWRLFIMKVNLLNPILKVPWADISHSNMSKEIRKEKHLMLKLMSLSLNCQKVIKF